jgi:peptide/nickel transport system substrate-binding protein
MSTHRIAAQRSRLAPLALIVALMMACAAPPAGSGSRPVNGQDAGSAARQAGPKRITAVIMGEPPTLSTKINTATSGGVVPGADAMEEMVSAGASRLDHQGTLRPQLAEAVPTLENGLWRLFPDGRMETTWRLVPNLRWHDGTPLTSADFLFAARLTMDRDLPVFAHFGANAVEDVQAPDAQTVVVTWREPYIQADTMFTSVFPPFALPVPAHLLERQYAEDKAGFTQLPFWNEGFVGAGPYRVREWVKGSHLHLAANEHYVLGKPRVDEVEVKFIPDHSTLVANVLAGAAELTLGRSVSLEQALHVRDQWRDGKMELKFNNWIVVYPQFINPSPAVVADVRFRRAMLHAIDREQMAETLQAGMVPVAHSWVNPSAPEYRAIERSIVRYDYDPRRSASLLEELGYARSGDSYRDRSGERLSVELRTTADNELHSRVIFPIVDYWQRLGVGVEPNLIPVQRQRDREYRANSPAFEMLQQGNDLGSLVTHHSREIPLPDNNFVGRSKHRYRNAEFDSLIDRHFATIPTAERMDVLAQLMHHITDQLVIMGIFYNVAPTLMSNRLVNVTPGGERSTQAWNAHEWDVK